MRTRDEHRFVVPGSIPKLKAEAQGLAARFTLVVEKGKNDSISTAWVALERLFLHAESIFPSAGFSLKSRARTWPNMLRLANAVVVACDHAEPPTNTPSVGV
jgi:hypothetical protein